MSESTRRKWFGQKYRAKYVAAAKQHDTSVTGLIRIVGPDDDGRTPDRAVVTRWLMKAGMSISQRRAVFSDEYKARYVEAHNAHPVASRRLIVIVGPDENGAIPHHANVSVWLKEAGVRVRGGTPVKYSNKYMMLYTKAAKKAGSVRVSKLIEQIGPDENGNTPDQGSVRLWIRNHCRIHGTFSDAYKARLIETARNGGLRFTITQLIEATGPAYGDHFPAQPTVSAWLTDAGVKLISSAWTPDQVEELRRMVEDDGLTVSAARNAFRNQHGKAPSERSLYRWFPDAVGRAEKHPPAPEPVVMENNKPIGPPLLERFQVEHDARTAKMCKTYRRKLWWSPETSTNPRWNPAARRLAA